MTHDMRTIGQTSDAGFQIGARRTLPIPLAEAWRHVARRPADLAQRLTGHGSRQGRSISPGRQHERDGQRLRTQLASTNDLTPTGMATAVDHPARGDPERRAHHYLISPRAPPRATTSARARAIAARVRSSNNGDVSTSGAIARMAAISASVAHPGHSILSHAGRACCSG